MAVISYQAKRDLAPGHVAGDDYDIEIYLARVDPGAKAERSQSRSLSGVSETYLHRIDREIDLTTDRMDQWEVVTEGAPRTLECFREFLASVMGGEEFYIDLWGSLAVPVAPLLFELTSNDYREQREGTRYISIAFTVRKVG